ncbi:MAG: transporter substrate-binding domain-containing protein [Synechococcaceae cyanobacterium ELA182]
MRRFLREQARLSCCGLAVSTALTATIVVSPAKAAEPGPPLRVGIVQNAMPCSDLNNGQTSGSAVDLWESIAQHQGWRYVLQPLPTPNDAVAAAATGKVDVAISCLNIIAERLEKVDFSVPYQEDSLAFLSSSSSEGVLSVLKKISREELLRDTIMLLFAITFVGTSLIWLISRGFHHKDIDAGNQARTFFKGWMMQVMGTGIYKMGTGPSSIMVVTLVNICRLVVTSVFVGTTATVVFKSTMPADVSEHDSLLHALRAGVGVDAGTVSELWLKAQAKKLNQPQLLGRIKPISGDGALLGALSSQAVGSIMADSARIEILSHKIETPSHYRISGQTYNKTPQAFVFGTTLDKSQRDLINLEISRMRFNGEIEAIVKRWHGS